ncbi:nitric oxide dioxygenase [Herbaspirillum sp. Sphag1AN]|uniref:NO-inducible flavohemoprotein n=1 Tax=unclassified Herbaspirillum TaxID=2624150 RepID=UPI00161061ED|nr:MULTISPECIES: NO-inducible flavohemoprotein [unclassified Herbaspirillum]MBB3212217.1 nitric oxide dioxygenase [Herbaspirillum sp. Sphag1AN]MBB3245685.1 nitric oxide dioxygenase [Herbaspirillum sp. Sphag64]
MLTPEQTAIVKATVPLLETGGETLTTHFYQIMLAEYAEVRPLFNQAHQQHGTQPRALANAVLQYARHIDNLGALGALPAQIIQKHVALQILPEHYPIVGTCLLRAIREVLGAEIATDAVIEAWGAAYWQLANLLIGAETAEYAKLADLPGGWRGARPFKVVRKAPESTEVSSFYLEPVDGGAVLRYQPGQYLGLQLQINGQEVRRNYSLSQQADGHSVRISVKREKGGVASTYLHDQINVGDVLNVFPPAGEFVLHPGTAPLALISGGVGITPTLAMAEAALADDKRDVIFVHYARNAEVHAFGETITTWTRQYPRLRAYIVYEHGATEAQVSGRPTREQLKAWIPADADAYFLGPKPFMRFINQTLADLGLPAERRRYEFFGPAEAL